MGVKLGFLLEGKQTNSECFRTRAWGQYSDSRERR